MNFCTCGAALPAGCEICEACFQKEMTRRMNLPHEKCCQKVAEIRKQLTEAKKAGVVGGNPQGWEIDISTGTPILMFEKCSVIQDEQAYMMMGALTKLTTLRAELAAARDEIAQLRKNCFTRGEIERALFAALDKEVGR